MRRPALFALATLILPACDNTRPGDVMAPITLPQFTVRNVPGDFASIQAAHDAASSGDVILVAPGTYVGQIRITKAITLASRYLTTGDESYIGSTVLDGGGALFVIEIPTGAEGGATIQGFTIRNAEDGLRPFAEFNLLNCVVRNTSDGIDFNDGSRGQVRFSTFELNGDDGLDLDDDVAVVIADNVVRNNSGDGIEIRMQPYSGPVLDIIIQRNEIHDNGGDGIQLIHYDVLTDRFFAITHNYVHDNSDAGVGMMDGAESSEDFRAASIPETIHIFNNTFANNSHGITGGDNTVVLNNIFVGHPVIAVKNVDFNSALAFNLFFNNGTDNSGSHVDVGNTVFADPWLTASLELTAGSPAIDAGTARYVWRGGTVLDLPATAYSGAAPDIGAFEFQSATGPAPNPPDLVSPIDGAQDVGLTPTLTWTGEADNFAVQLARDAGFAAVVHDALVSTTQYTVAVGALDHSTTYFWRVNASNASGTSDYSAVRSFTTAATVGPPDPPILRSPADGATGVALEATLEWAGTADNFDVQVARDPQFSAVVFAGNTSSRTITLPANTLLHETTYYWHVRGNNSFGSGDFSTAFVFTTIAPPDNEPPTEPQNLRSTARTATTVGLAWNASDDNVGVSGYNIYRDGVSVANESSTNHTAVGLTPATTYQFQVSALDASGNESAKSAPVSVTTLPRSIHVSDMSVAIVKQGKNYLGRATVLVFDQDGIRAAGVQVVGSWTRNSTVIGTGGGITGANGAATFDSPKRKAARGDVFTFTVTNLILDAYTYDSASNVKSSASAAVP